MKIEGNADLDFLGYKLAGLYECGEREWYLRKRRYLVLVNSGARLNVGVESTQALEFHLVITLQFRECLPLFLVSWVGH